jgi:hypothetical protein
MERLRICPSRVLQTEVENRMTNDCLLEKSYVNENRINGTIPTEIGLFTELQYWYVILSLINLVIRNVHEPNGGCKISHHGKGFQIGFLMKLDAEQPNHRYNSY